MSANDYQPVSRRRFLAGAIAGTAVAAAPVYAKAPGVLRGAGDIRRLRMYCGRTGEAIDTVYWIEGYYIKPVLEEVDHFMRDWRKEKTKKIDYRTLDILAATHHLLNTTEPFKLLSGYRTESTNSMLRRQSRGVARNSLHIKGQAADISLRTRSVTQIADAGKACKSGGVGKYSRSSFVHLDCGDVRAWGA